MSDPSEVTAASPRQVALYRSLFWLYPARYRKRFGPEMLLVFAEMYEDELAQQGKVGLGFWRALLVDLAASVLAQHQERLRSDGMKHYLQQTLNIKLYHVLGAIMLVPFALLLLADLIGRVLQGDITHPNLNLSSALAPILSEPGQTRLLWLILVYAPVVAIMVNLIPFLVSLSQQHQQLTLSRLLLINPLAIVLIGLGLFVVVFTFGHDVLPCIAYQLFAKGLREFGQTLSVCWGA